MKMDQAAALTSLIVVQHWLEDLKRLVPTGKSPFREAPPAYAGRIEN